MIGFLIRYWIMMHSLIITRADDGFLVPKGQQFQEKCCLKYWQMPSKWIYFFHWKTGFQIPLQTRKRIPWWDGSWPPNFSLFYSYDGLSYMNGILNSRQYRWQQDSPSLNSRQYRWQQDSPSTSFDILHASFFFFFL